ncbi:MAG: putative toxin-antitoxin system toxin component, PIN family [Bacteroidia bacterium]
MNDNIIRVVIDTNVWISFLITKNQSALDNFLFNNNLRILFSEELFDEFLLVAGKRKFEKNFPRETVTSIAKVFKIYTEFVQVKTKIEICRDHTDNFLLALSIDGHADFLITGDKDLLALQKIHQTMIITYRQFIDAN